MPKPDLQGRVALVTGASRGVGRGIALVLGKAGAAVYFTGRNTAALETVAGEIRDRGGIAHPVQCDHTIDAQVETLIQRIRDEAGGLDHLINNVWGGYEAHPNGLGMDPFWKLGTEDWDAMFQRGVRAHLVASRLAVPLMLGREHGLIVNTIAWAQGKYLRHIYYDLAKHATARMAYGMSLELRKHRVTALALAPGFVRTEAVMAAHAAHPFDLSGTESPEYIGRAVAHLAADPKRSRYTGQTLTVGALARDYGFTDIDGSQPQPFEMPSNLALD